MIYVECKIWHFHGSLQDSLREEQNSDDDYSQKCRCKTIESLWNPLVEASEQSSEEREHHTVKAMIDTSSSVNFISENLANKLGEKYGEHYKNERVENSLGTITCLEISFQYKGKDRLVSGSDEFFNDFEVIKNPNSSRFSTRRVKLGSRASEQTDLILGLPWLWARAAKIDMWKKGITIYGDFVPFCKGPGKDDYFYNSSGEPESNSSDESINEIVERYQPKKRKTRRKYKVFSIQSNPMIRHSQK